MSEVEVFVIMDNAQYVHNDYHSRNFLKINGEKKSIRVPIIKPPIGTPINKVKIDKKRYFTWLKKFEKTLFHEYKDYKGFKNLSKHLNKIFKDNNEELMKLNLKLIFFIKNLLGIKTKIYFSSDLEKNKKDSLTKTERLVKLLESVNCNSYLSGRGAKKYIEEKMFSRNGIKLSYTENLPKNSDSLVYISILDKLLRDY